MAANASETAGPDRSAAAFFNALSTMQAEYELIAAENRMLRQRRSEAVESGIDLREVEQEVPFEEGFCLDSGHQPSETSNFSPRSGAAELHPPLNSGRRSVFPNAEEVRTQLQTIADGPEPSYTRDSTCRRIATHPYFQNLDMFMIGVYAVWMGLDAEHNTEMLITDAQAAFQAMDQLFCAYFVIELGIRYFAFEKCWDRLRDPWFVLDSILVPLTVFDTWVMTIISLTSNVNEQDAASVRRSELIRLFRTLRLVRICRVAKLVRFVPELMVLIKAMFTAFRAVFFALLLLIVSLYTVAIAFHVTLQGSAAGEQMFGSVLASMQTLYIHCTLVDEVPSLVAKLTAEQLWVHLAAAYVVMFINAITLMNIIIGVVLEVISTVAVAERESVNEKWVEEVIGQFLGETEWISRSDLYTVLQGQSASAALKLIGVDTETLLETVDGCYKETRISKAGFEQCSISFHDFVQCVLRLRGSNAATVKDMVDLRKVLRSTQKEMSAQMEAWKKGTPWPKRAIRSRRTGEGHDSGKRDYFEDFKEATNSESL